MCDAKMMKGGSLASDMVMEGLKDAAGMPYDFLPAQPKQSDLSVLTEYQLTGGARRKSKKSKKSMKPKKSNKPKSGCGCGMAGGAWGKKNNKKMTKMSKRKMSKKSKKSMKKMSKVNNMMKMNKKMLGGGSDFVTTLYSQGPINNPGDYSGSFSVSEPSSKNMLMNPPNLASAGSGYPMCYFSGAGAPY